MSFSVLFASVFSTVYTVSVAAAALVVGIICGILLMHICSPYNTEKIKVMAHVADAAECYRMRRYSADAGECFAHLETVLKKLKNIGGCNEYYGDFRTRTKAKTN